jgi:hypothetical protein
MLFTKILLGLSSSTRFFTIFHRFNANDRVLAQVSLAKSMPRTGPRLQHIDPTPRELCGPEGRAASCQGIPCGSGVLSMKTTRAIWQIQSGELVINQIDV